MMHCREHVLAYNLAIQRNYFGRGHCKCRPQLVQAFSAEWDFVTILRHPVDRWISEYVYNTYKQSDWVKNRLSLDEYLGSSKGGASGNYLVRYFSDAPSGLNGNSAQYIEEALGNLARFSVVGTLDNLETWVSRMNDHFGIALDIPKVNSSPKNERAEEIRSDASLMKRIEEACKYDLELYDRYLERFE